MFTWLLLPGCPYIFGPPDVSNVPTGGDSRPTVLDPTDETAGTGSTGDTGPTPVPPEITNSRLDPTVEGFQFRLSVIDPDANLVGGHVTVERAGPTLDFGIPDDVNLVAGDLRLTVPSEDPCASWDHTFALTVYDALGTPSLPAEIGSSALGAGLAEEGPLLALGTVEPIFTTCGGIDSANDRDRFSFFVASDTRLRLSLTWNSTADIDYTVFRNGQVWASGVDIVQPEVVEREFGAGIEYVVEIYKVPNPSQPTPDLYQLLVLPAP